MTRVVGGATRSNTTKSTFKIENHNLEPVRSWRVERGRRHNEDSVVLEWTIEYGKTYNTDDEI